MWNKLIFKREVSNEKLEEIKKYTFFKQRLILILLY